MARIIEISDLTAPELSVYSKLTEAQLRSAQWSGTGMFIAESPQVIECALKAGCRPVSFLMEKKHISGKGAALIWQCGDIPVYTAGSEILASLTGFSLTRGILCAMERRPLMPIELVCRDAARIVILENIVDPTNVGAIFRSAAGLGMDAVLVTPSCCDPLHRRAARVSMGTVFQIPWTRIGETAEDWPELGMKRLREMGFFVAALALGKESLSIDDPSLQQVKRLAVLLGTEGDGLSEKTVAESDITVRIPMAHGVDSLNVAAAGAVAFWQLRQNMNNKEIM